MADKADGESLMRESAIPQIRYPFLNINKGALRKRPRQRGG
jgi:hypothetical protein